MTFGNFKHRQTCIKSYNSGHPVLDPDARDDPLPVDDVMNHEDHPPVDTKWWKGWRCSYKKAEENSVAGQRLRNTLHSTSAVVGEALVGTKEAVRRPDQHEHLITIAATRARAKERYVEEKSFLAKQKLEDAAAGVMAPVMPM